jgi:hypothetical protein
MEMGAVALPKALDVGVISSLVFSPLMKLQTFVRFDNAAFKKELAAPEESPIGWDNTPRETNKIGWDDTPKETDIIGWDDEPANAQMDSSQPVGLSSPGKRKYRGSDDGTNQYQRVNVTEKELSDGSGTVDGNLGNGAGIMEDVLLTNGKQHEIIVGVDPSLIMKDSEGGGQEMKERGGMPMLSGRKMSVQQTSTIDIMDLEQVVEDEHVAEESTAVKQVGFAE